MICLFPDWPKPNLTSHAWKLVSVALEEISYLGKFVIPFVGLMFACFLY